MVEFEFEELVCAAPVSCEPDDPVFTTTLPPDLLEAEAEFSGLVAFPVEACVFVVEPVAVAVVDGAKKRSLVFSRRC